MHRGARGGRGGGHVSSRGGHAAAAPAAPAAPAPAPAPVAAPPPAAPAPAPAKHIPAMHHHNHTNGAGGGGAAAPVHAASPGGAGAGADGEELASKIIMCEQKRVWVDLKSNPRGKFLKISEQDAAGTRQKINVPLSGAARFRDILTTLAALDATLGDAPTSSSAAATDAAGGPAPPIKSESFRTENKMFYFDLRQNVRGRFLKISQVMGHRTTIVIPARGIPALREAVEEVCKADPQGGAGLEPVPTIPQDQLPQSSWVTAEQKRFFFDVGSNPRGVFLRISEVVGSYRTSITVPQTAWAQFRHVIQECENGMATVAVVSAGDADPSDD